MKIIKKIEEGEKLTNTLIGYRYTKIKGFGWIGILSINLLFVLLQIRLNSNKASITISSGVILFIPIIDREIVILENKIAFIKRNDLKFVPREKKSNDVRKNIRIPKRK